MKNFVVNISIVICFLWIVIGCNSSSDRELILEEGNYNSGYEVYENKERDTTKLFSVTSKITNGIHSLEGVGFQMMIRLLEKSYSEKEFVLNDVKDTISLDILYESDLDNSTKREILDRILEYYNLKLVMSSKLKDYQELYIVDEAKLKQFECVSKTRNGESTKKNGKISIKCMGLDQLALELKEENDPIIFKGNKQRYFTLEFLNDSLSRDSVLLEEYGLGLKPIQQKVGVYTISKK
ncbi:hypothetical protein [Mesonia sp.]|uniref:hypothetical protein n=1 Tax=Mesonia sp. TaxID=1960830 RepID=UPI0017540270|nr:hypothetical protein [Mesonia sp.]HIB38047.1 hypothetical protein [Mesonia sp.]HIO27909.1 hypothetical protein [Flavobacteriaceae bacterium]